jgi:cytochrome c-type biogenesis protein CcmE
MKIKHIIGGVIILAFGFYAISSFDSSITPYVSIAEAMESGINVQVKGQKAGEGKFDIEKNVFTFSLQDENGNIINVVYNGAKPGNFDQATEVVCQGKYENGVFHANNILVKCPSKYQEMET